MDKGAKKKDDLFVFSDNWRWIALSGFLAYFMGEHQLLSTKAATP